MISVFRRTKIQPEVEVSRTKKMPDLLPDCGRRPEDRARDRARDQAKKLLRDYGPHTQLLAYPTG